MSVDVIVLAAGASTRMGHPKALTQLGPETALERVFRVAHEAGLGAPLVVLGPGQEAVVARHAALLTRMVVNPRPELGRTGSLQRGLAATSAQHVLVLPIDHPLVAAATLRALAARSEAWVVPTHGGRGGHPLKLGPLGVAAVMSAPPATPLRDVPGMVGIEPTRLAVEDPGILLNLDRPEDVDRALASGGSGQPEGS